MLRLVAGSIFIGHGVQTLFVYGFAGVTGALHPDGDRPAGREGPFIGLLEFFGGIALVMDLLTRLATLGLAFDMLGAIRFMHHKGGFPLPSGVEFALECLGSTVALALAGAGQFSLDAFLARRRPASATEAGRAVRRRPALTPTS